MLDIRLIREERERVEKALRDRGLRFDLEALVALDAERRTGNRPTRGCARTRRAARAGWKEVHEDAY